MKKVLILLGNPNNEGLDAKLAKAYKKGAETTNAEIKYVQIADLKFDPILHKGYKEIQELEPDLKQLQADITWCNHLVLVYPVWWSGFPALLKGLFDRLLVPGFAFKFKESGLGWEKLLTGKSARCIQTSGSPIIVLKLFYANMMAKMVKRGVLGFCGFSPVKFTYFGQVDKKGEEEKNKWVNQVEELGKKLK